MTQQPVITDITNDDKIWAALGYPVWPIAVIMLLIEGKKNRPFIKFHAIQALALNVVFWIVEIVLRILSGALAKVTLGIGGVLSCIIPLLWLLLLWPAILAFQGKYFEVPVITKFLRDQHWIS
ncbi:MAG: hypothetical protein ABSF99_14010 [Anaerolineales bacterium]|jgi:uncharacterized membrane protein